jgi:gas vesicle protein
MTENAKLWSAVLAGAAAGVAIGLLFAPNKGSKTRQAIQDGARKLMHDLTDKIRQGKEAVHDVKDKVRDAALDREEKVGTETVHAGDSQEDIRQKRKYA